MKMNNRRSTYRSGYRVPSDAFGSLIVNLRYPTMTLWKTLKNFINNLEINEEFIRRQVLHYIYINDMYNHDTIIDIYNLQLVRVGILEWSPKGIYTKIKNIPKSLNTVLLKKLSNKSRWGSWLISIDMLD